MLSSISTMYPERYNRHTRPPRVRVAPHLSTCPDYDLQTVVQYVPRAPSRILVVRGASIASQPRVAPWVALSPRTAVPVYLAACCVAIHYVSTVTYCTCSIVTQVQHNSRKHPGGRVARVTIHFV